MQVQPMKVGELIRQLSDLDPDLEVVMSRDAEGNGFSPLSGFEVGHYDADCTYSGEWSESSEVAPENSVAFWPVN